MAKINRLLLLLGLLAPAFTTFGQRPATVRQYVVLLTDKTNTPFSVSAPGRFLSARAVERRQRQNLPITERDLPVDPAYVARLRQAGATVRYTSRWLNAALIEATDPVLTAVRALPFVRGLAYNGALGAVGPAATPLPEANVTGQSRGKFGTREVPAYGLSRDQIVQLGVDQMHAGGYTGAGRLVAILDAGFSRATTLPFLQPLFQQNRLVATYDFADHERDVYDDDDHGLNVLSVMAGAASNELVGPAYGASYMLLRTEVAASERPIEEMYWLLGAEFADSTGADVLNSSLGYTEFDFDYSQYDHTYEQLDGRTTLVSRAAQWAAEAGMVVVVSAGNSGNDPWRYLGAPADAPGVLAIAAVDRQGQRAEFSSFGPAADGRVKPDLAALGQGTVLGSADGRVTAGNGTSFAAPLVAGLAAGFWQAFPGLTAAQVVDCLRRAGSQYAQPDDELGYGIPTFARAAAVASERYPLQATTALLLYPNPFTEGDELRFQWNEPVGAPRPANVVVSATLTDVAGRVLWQQQYDRSESGTLPFATLRLPPGLYLLTLVAPDRRQTVRVLKR